MSTPSAPYQGLLLWGRVNALGAVPIPGGYRFVIKAPTISGPYKTKVWVHWLGPIFKPEPKQELECFGRIQLTELIFRDGKDSTYRGSITLTCTGHEIRPLTPERAKSLRLNVCLPG